MAREEPFFIQAHTDPVTHPTDEDTAIAMVKRMLQPPTSPFEPYPLLERFRAPWGRLSSSSLLYRISSLS